MAGQPPNMVSKRHDHCGDGRVDANYMTSQLPSHFSRLFFASRGNLSDDGFDF